MHQIREQITKEEEEQDGWLSFLNVCNAAGDMPCVSAFGESAVRQVMSGMYGEDCISQILAGYGGKYEQRSYDVSVWTRYQDLFDLESRTMYNKMVVPSMRFLIVWQENMVIR